MNHHHLLVHPQVTNAAFSFFFPVYKVVPSRLSPGLSALPLLTWCYRLTSVAETEELKRLCFPFLPHHWCHFAYFYFPGNPSFGSFSSLVAAQGFHHRSDTWAFYTCLFVRCVNVLFFPFFVFFYQINVYLSFMQHYVMIQRTLQGCG